MFDAARRAWLKGEFRSSARPRRPPGAIDEARFQRTCVRCDDCLAACPRGVLRRGDGGFPQRIENLGCDACDACTRACRSGALVAVGSTPTLRLGSDCLAAHGVACRSCGDGCATRAIRFRPRPGGRTLVRIEAGACTGCGDCVALCPVGALDLVRIHTQEIA